MEKNFKYIYLFKCGKKFYKIGISENPESRRQSIESSNPWLVHMITARKVVNASQLEVDLHNKLKNKKKNGEWFELTNDEVVKACIMIHKAKAPKIVENYNAYKLSNSLLRLKEEIKEFKKEMVDGQKLIINTMYGKQIRRKKKQNLVSIVREKIEIDKDLIEKAISLAKENGFLSASFLQRKLSIGYARAARIMDLLEKRKIVGPLHGAKRRKVL